MAYQTGSFQYLPTGDGDEGLKLDYVEAAAQVFLQGDLVFVNAAGDISLAGADPADILGFALSDANQVTAERVSVQVIRPTDVFVMRVRASADTFALTDTEALFDIVRTAAGNWEVDKSASAAARVKVLGSLEIDPHQATGFLATQGGPVYVKFVAANLQFDN